MGVISKSEESNICDWYNMSKTLLVNSKSPELSPENGHQTKAIVTVLLKHLRKTKSYPKKWRLRNIIKT